MVPYIIKTPCKQKSATARSTSAATLPSKTLTASAFARYEQQCRLKETDSIDFSQVGKADSACVSLLLNALRRTDKKPTIQNIPDSVRALAELYEIKDWLQS